MPRGRGAGGMQRELCNKKRRFARPALLAALAALGAIQDMALAASSTWANLGNDWFGSLNWVGGVPSAGIGAVLPPAPLVVTPDIGTGVAETPGLSIDNSGGGIYNLGP